MKNQNDLLEKWQNKINLLNKEMSLNNVLSDYQPKILINTKNLISEFIVDIESLVKISPYNLSHNELVDCCGCFDIIDKNGIILCNECGMPLHEAISNIKKV